jgi:hypothetical protein
MDKMFQHLRQDDTQHGAAKEDTEHKPSFAQKLKAEEKKEAGKFHNYMEKDRQMQAEGKEYGGLM